MTEPPRPAAPTVRLWLAVFAGYLALGGTLQELPSYVQQRFHGGPVLAGVAVGLAFAATAVGRPFAGRSADGGRSRPVAMTGGVLTAVGALGHLVAPDPAVLLVARLVMGAGEALLFSGALPWVLTAAPVHRRGRVAGWFGLSMWGGLAAGPLLAGALHALGGFRAVWCGVLALGLLSAAMVLATRSPRRDAAPARRAGLSGLLPRGALLPGAGLGLAAYGYGTINAVLVLFLRHDGVGGDALALAVFAAGFLLVRALGSPLVDRFGGPRVALATLCAEAAGLAVIALATGPATALSGAALTGAGVGLMYPATVAATLRRTGPLRPGASVAAMTSLWDLGLLAGGPVAGLLAAGVGYRAAFAAAVLATAAAFAVAARLRHTEHIRRAPGWTRPELVRAQGNHSNGTAR